MYLESNLEVIMKIVRLVVAGFFVAGSVFAQQIIYPKNNQTPEQQKKDEFDCHTWAVQQSGYDPITASQTATLAAPTEMPKPEQGSAVKGAAKGAAVGAIGGAIAGDAGEGAAIGAAAGAVAGRHRSKREAQEEMKEKAEDAQEAAAKKAQLAEKYNKARAACLEGKGYVVK
jgi:hypothetical protein